jgi:hypothetical protein
MDDADGTRWLSYPELATSRGISVASASRLVRRRKWQRRTGNDGTVRILVPGGQDSRSDARPDIPAMVREFAAAVAALTERAVTAETRAQAVEADASAWWAQSRWRRVRQAWRGR